MSGNAVGEGWTDVLRTTETRFSSGPVTASENRRAPNTAPPSASEIKPSARP